MRASLPDAFNCSARTVILPVVPMFHVNAWSIPYFAPMNGAKLVFPGAGLDGKSLYELFEAEKVTVTAGVPTVWLGAARLHEAEQAQVQHAEDGGGRRLGLPAGDDQTRSRKSTACSCQHAWGMTEMSPLGTLVHAEGQARIAAARKAARSASASRAA